MSNRFSSTISFGVLGLLAASGCAPSSATAPIAPASNTTPTVAFAHVTLTDLTVAPTKPGGRPWDGVGSGVSPTDAAALVTAMGMANPYAAAIAVLERPTMQAIDPPDIKGLATLFLGATQQPAQAFRSPRDTCRPTLQPSPSWARVPLDGTARVRVEVVDEDMQFDDPIGVFEVGAYDLNAALQAGNVFQAKVAEQTGNTVLFVGISAIAER